MKKFRFSLDAALRLREAQLRMEESKLKELLAGEQRLRRSLGALYAERHDAGNYVCQHSGDPLAIRTLPGYVLGLGMRRANLTQSLDEITVAICEQRQRVAVLERAVKLLTKLREKRHAEWQLGVDREIEATAQECWLAMHSDLGKA